MQACLLSRSSYFLQITEYFSTNDLKEAKFKNILLAKRYWMLNMNILTFINQMKQSKWSYFYCSSALLIMQDVLELRVGWRGSPRLCFNLETSVPREGTNINKASSHKLILYFPFTVNCTADLTISSNSINITQLSPPRLSILVLLHANYVSVKSICGQLQIHRTGMIEVPYF